MKKISAFKKPEILKLARNVIKRDVCNNCLGRQFAMISTGLSNKRRGEIIRKLLGSKEPKHCTICNDIFKKLDAYAERALKKLKPYEIKTFLVGCRVSVDTIKNEESLWEDIGIEYCESIKSELNRELGKIIEKKTDYKFKRDKQDVIIIFDFQNDSISIMLSPLFIVGRYKKLVRNISQSKWKKYKDSVESVIAKPLIKATKGKETSFHGAGREDVDAKCLDWRPFVIEIEEPKKRSINLKKIEREINKSKKVLVSNLRFGTKDDVRKIKSMRTDKTYRVIVRFEKPLKNLEKLKTLVGVVKQKTPTRVLHRRSDLLRKRIVKSIKYRKMGNKKLELEIRCEAGFYVKEFITGDNGRTTPSISEVLDNPAKVISLDVIKIYKKS